MIEHKDLDPGCGGTAGSAWRQATLERLDDLAADEALQANCMFQLSLILARIALEPFADSYKEATEQVLLGLIRNKPKNNVVHLFDPAPVRKPLMSLVSNQTA